MSQISHGLRTREGANLHSDSPRGANAPSVILCRAARSVSASKRHWLFAIVLSWSVTGHASDWPTYLGSNARSGSTSEQLTLPLTKHWVWSSPRTPRRAWSGPEGRTVEGKLLSDRVKFDDAFQVAIAGERVFFGSSVDHQLHCLDMKTGRELWQFFTNAPIRLAPTVDSGRVYFGSDDGYAYCVGADDGHFIWKLRLGPDEEWIIGRGELISRWPVRTGVLIDGGLAHFGAGIFPHENVYLCAAKADDGTLIWRNDHISHQDAGRNDLSPQGYLLATKEHLYVPSARTQPRSFNRESGTLTGDDATSLRFAETRIAGTDAIIVDRKLHTFSLGTRLAARGEASYSATGRFLMRMDHARYASAETRRNEIRTELRHLERRLRSDGHMLPDYKARVAELQKLQEEFEIVGVVWRTPCRAKSALIVVGDLVIAGDEGRVLAFDAESGQQVWQEEIEGEARGLAVAGGRLIVSTTTGRIVCFSGANGADTNPANDSSARVVADPWPQDKLTTFYEQAAEQILKHSERKRGYCLIVGSERGRLAFELAKRSELKIYGIEPDETKLVAARRALSAAGLYGHRITLHQGDLSSIPYSKYFANLIVSERMLLTGELPAEAGPIVRHLKPAGGVFCLGRPADAPGAHVATGTVSEWLQRTQSAVNGTVRAADHWVTLTRGTLPGAGNWSHQYAEPGNTANSGDKLVKGGLGVLWYGDPGPDLMVNRHQGAVGPLVVDGRMFVQGTDKLMAYDAYNGLLLWEQPNPRAVRTGVFQNRTPGNLAASESDVFHMVRDTVFQHDAATGAIRTEHALPSSVDSATQEWGYVAVRDGLLIGTSTVREVVERALRRRGNPGTSATDAIFAIDVKSGEHLWKYQGKSIDFQTIALGQDRVFFIDSSVTSRQREEILRQDKSELSELTGQAAENAEQRMKNLDVRLAVALNARTGEVLWSRPVDVTDCSEIGIGGGKLTLVFKDGVLLLCGANANGHYWKQFVAGDFSKRRLVALSAEDGYKLWAKDANYRHRPIIVGERVIAEPWSYDLQTGEQITRTHPVTGLDVPWSIMRPGHHCGMLTGCDNLLLFRSNYTGFYDLKADAGTRHFAGHRLGCWINAIPTNGLVVIPEASAGCVCMFSIASTIVMEPREPRRPWSLYSVVGATTPVRHLALNLGAPGDRRDNHGRLWLAYPRPIPNPSKETSLDLKLEFSELFHTGGSFFSNDGDREVAESTDLAWVASSGARNLNRCSIPVLGKDDPPASYRLRLYFAAETDAKPGSRICHVKVQGLKVPGIIDAAQRPTDATGLLVCAAGPVPVRDNLVVELIGDANTVNSNPLPVLSGIEVTRVDIKEPAGATN